MARTETAGWFLLPVPSRPLSSSINVGWLVRPPSWCGHKRHRRCHPLTRAAPAFRDALPLEASNEQPLSSDAYMFSPPSLSCVSSPLSLASLRPSTLFLLQVSAWCVPLSGCGGRRTSGRSPVCRRPDGSALQQQLPLERPVQASG